MEGLHRELRAKLENNMQRAIRTCENVVELECRFGNEIRLIMHMVRVCLLNFTASIIESIINFYFFFSLIIEKRETMTFPAKHVMIYVVIY